MSSGLEARVARLEARMNTVEGTRPGRKPKPIVISEEHVCGVDPERDSGTCPDASLYRHQKGCKGDQCAAITAAYYDNYRKRKVQPKSKKK